MPTYDYICSACKAHVEIFQKITDEPVRKCPSCGKKKLERQLGTGAAIVFKGSGFYQTDYRSDSYRKAAESDQKPSASTPAADSSSASSSGSPPPSESKSSTTPAPSTSRPASQPADSASPKPRRRKAD